MQNARNDFQLLCDTIDLLLVDSAPHIPHPHYQLPGKCVVLCSLKATNGKCTLYLYNEAFTELVDQAEVGNLTELFDQLSHWKQY